MGAYFSVDAYYLVFRWAVDRKYCSLLQLLQNSFQMPLSEIQHSFKLISWSLESDPKIDKMLNVDKVVGISHELYSPILS